MTTSTTLRLPLIIPDAVDLNKKHSIQLAIHGEDRDTAIFLDQQYQLSDLTATSENERSKVLNLPRANIARFRRQQDTTLQAYFWKGQKFVGTVDLGSI
jgi:hypothetical protein